MADLGLRWLLKKAARRGMAVTASARSATPRRREQHASLRVLTYHRFGEESHDPFCVRAADFEQQMALLANESLLVSLSDLEEFLAGARNPPDGGILVTIDDGCPSVRTVALPILREYRIPAVAFIPAGEVAEDGRHGSSNREHPDDRMSWTDLEELARAGIVIGSHAWTHHSVARMPIERAREHAARSREAIERRLGTRVTAFAYPFGTRADYNTATAAVLKEVGYACAFTSQHGAIRPHAEPFTLPRVKVEGGEGLWMFRALVRGGLDAWGWIDRTLWKLQAAGT
ncbi:MAG: polysaccharide deacetylase family protein [Deltaproteobacteria bacterium]|nr:polysaccharide deacetylase family protein [Deltaproteobacteria bacterium]